MANNDRLLKTDRYRGRYLAQSVDFRDIMGEPPGKLPGNTDPDLPMPGHTFVALDMFETA